MRRLLPVLSVLGVVAIVAMLSSCGGDDPPPADIHPLATKPLPLNPLAKPVDHSKADSELAMVMAFAKKKYPTGLDFDDTEVFNHEVTDKRMDPNGKFDYDVTPKFEVIIALAKLKEFNPHEATGQGFMPGVSSRRFGLFDGNRITEEEPLRIPMRHRHH